jgi:NAD(P)-dependent dehydrogenase (short-subunit alcohol dehydrogenase family)
MNTALVFGSCGGIGNAVVKPLQADFSVVPFTRKMIDFSNIDAVKFTNSIISLTETADEIVIVNCIGVLGVNHDSNYRHIFDANLGSNWRLIQHFMTHTATKPVKLILVGSSAYKSGKAEYMLYASSKAALYNLWQGARDYFKDTTITVCLVNPVRTRTRMIDSLTTQSCLEPEDVAEVIANLATTNTESVCIDMKYKD